MKAEVERMVIFSPGPSNISERVRKALTLPDICHRDAEFTEILEEGRDLLLKVCGVGEGYRSVILTGSGTAAIDGAISSLKGVVRKLLVVVNGEYGKRAAEMARLYGVEVAEVRCPIDRLPDPDRVGEAIERPDIDAVYLVHHETTTGMLNPLKDVGRIAKSCGKPVIVDGISSIAGEELEIEGWGVEAIIGSSSKCIRGVPGISFVVGGDSFFEAVRKREKKTFYTDLVTHLDREEEGETPFTPPVQVFYAFREALRETLEEGVENRIRKYKALSSLLRRGLKEEEFTLFLPEETYSNTMTSVYLPRGTTYRELHGELKKRGYVIYNAMGDLRGKIFRLGTVGLIDQADIEGFLDAIGEILR